MSADVASSFETKEEKVKKEKKQGHRGKALN